MRRDNLKAVGYIEEDCHGDKSPRNDSWSGFVREIATASKMPRNDTKKPPNSRRLFLLLLIYERCAVNSEFTCGAKAVINPAVLDFYC